MNRTTQYSHLKSSNSATTYRKARIAESLKEEISEIVSFELDDERISSVDITEVKLSPGMQNATVYVNVVGDDTVTKLSIQVLNHAASYIRKQLALRLNLRKTPQLHFVLDTVVPAALRIEQILKEIVPSEESVNSNSE